MDDGTMSECPNINIFEFSKILEVFQELELESKEQRKF